jgi:Ca2+-transporting ATPase
MEAIWTKTKKDLLNKLKSSEDGLSQKQAEQNLSRFGKNVLVEGKKKSVFAVFVEQFCDLLVIILIIASIISMISGDKESTFVILAVITLNAILGTVQHIKAQKSLDSLKSLSSPNAKVIRDNAKIEIPSSQVALGDIWKNN